MVVTGDGPGDPEGLGPEVTRTGGRKQTRAGGQPDRETVGGEDRGSAVVTTEEGRGMRRDGIGKTRCTTGSVRDRGSRRTSPTTGNQSPRGTRVGKVGVFDQEWGPRYTHNPYTYTHRTPRRRTRTHTQTHARPKGVSVHTPYTTETARPPPPPRASVVLCFLSESVRPSVRRPPDGPAESGVGSRRVPPPLETRT